MATCSGLGLVASSDYPWKKQYRSDDSPPRAPGPTLEPIFSLLFIESLPTSHTDKVFGWLFKGSIKSLFWQGWYLFSFPLQAPDATKTPLLALVSMSEEHRGWRDWTHDSASLTPGGSLLRRESHATQSCGVTFRTTQRGPPIPVPWEASSLQHPQSLTLIPRTEITDAAEIRG